MATVTICDRCGLQDDVHPAHLPVRPADRTDRIVDEMTAMEWCDGCIQSFYSDWLSVVRPAP